LRLRDAQENGKIIYSLGLYEPVTLLTVGSRESTIDSLTGRWLEVRTTSGLTGWCFGGYMSKESPDEVNMQAFLRLDQDSNQLYSFYSISGQEERFNDEKVALAHQGKEIRNIRTMILLNDGETLVFTVQNGDWGEIYSYNFKTGAINLLVRSMDISCDFPSLHSDQFSGSSRFYYKIGINSYVYDCKTGENYSFDYKNAGYRIVLYGDYLYGYLMDDSGYPVSRADAQGPYDEDFVLFKYMEENPNPHSYYNYGDSRQRRKVTGQLFNKYLLIEESRGGEILELFLFDTENGEIEPHSQGEGRGIRDIWVSDREKTYTWHNGSSGLRINPDGTWSAFGTAEAKIIINYYTPDFEGHNAAIFTIPRSNGPEPRILGQKSWLLNDTLFQFFCFDDSGPRYYESYKIRNGISSHFLLDKGSESSRKKYLFFPIVY